MLECVDSLLLSACIPAQLWLTLCDLMDCSLSRPFVHGDSPGMNTAVVAVSLSRAFSLPRDWTQVSCIGRQVLYHWTTNVYHLFIFVYLYVSSAFKINEKENIFVGPSFSVCCGQCRSWPWEVGSRDGMHFKHWCASDLLEMQIPRPHLLGSRFSRSGVWPRNLHLWQAL